jgi:hypothetical protein
MMTLYLKRVIPAVRAAGLNADGAPNEEELQTAVYLLERAGAQLGYRYTWDVGGPFSESLSELWRTAKRSNISLEGAADAETADEFDRAGGLVNRLRDERPNSIGDEPTWFRLLTCVDFLERRSGVPLTNGQTPDFLERRYGRPAIDAARDVIEEVLPRPREPLALP